MTAPLSQSLMVRFVADFGNLNRGLDGVQGRFRAVAGGIKGIAAAGAALGTVSFLKGAIEEAREAAKVGKQTEAVLKSTGGAANVSAGQVGALAERLSNLAGVDDEVIQGNANLLLTFTKVRNEVGKGNNVFDQGTEAALNMSTAMGTDMKSATVMVGKALNDPIKGITAMSRAGVQFTQQQKDQIKAMVESGNTLGAQKMILKELNTQFGGMAAASADAGMKAKVSFDNMKEALGERLLPVFNHVASYLTSTVIPVISNLAQRLAAWLAPMIQKVSEFLTTKLVPAVKSVVDWVQTQLWPVVQRVFSMIIPMVMPVIAVITNLAEIVLRKLWEVLTTNILPAIKGLVDWLDRNRIVVAMVMGAVIALTASMITMRVVTLATAAALRVVAIAQGIVNAVMRANPFAIVITIIGALVGAFIHLWNTSKTFRNVVTGVWDAVKNTISWVWENVIKRVFNAFKSTYESIGGGFKRFVDGIGRAWNKIKEIMAAPINFVIRYVYNNGIRWAWNKVADVIGFGKLPEGKPIKLAGGGVLGGYAPGRDSVHALLSPGESVLVPELTRAIGPANIMRANKAASGRQGTITGGGGGMAAFAGGGVIGKVLDVIGGAAKSTVQALTNPIEFIGNRVGKGTDWLKAVATFPVKMIGRVGEKLWNYMKEEGVDSATKLDDMRAIWNFLSGGGGSGSFKGMGVKALQLFAMKQRGKLYQWGATGPNTWDCSGLVGALWAMVHGKNPYQRYMTTATMGVGKHGMKPGPGVFTVYLGPGHTAANIAGLHAEAYGGNGTPLAIGRIGTPLSFYDRIMHVFGGGGVIGMKNDPQARLASWAKRGWPEPYVFDNGGVWRSGTLGVNTSGNDEYVFNPKKNGIGEKHYHLHANVTNQPIDLVQQFMRMELLEPPR